MDQLLKFINNLSFIDTREKRGFKDDFIVYSQVPIVSTIYPSYRWVARYPNLIVNEQGWKICFRTSKPYTIIMV